jgi:YD repeat-containing protein
MNPKKLIAIGAGCICAGSLAHANQTVNYTYDALGRLVGTQTQGGTGAGTTQVFQYDAAGNRTQYQALMQITLSMNSPMVNLTSTGATITVNLNSPSAGGTVTFSENGTVLGSTSVADGQATVILEGLSKGSQTITVNYSGDGADTAQTTTFTINVENLGWLPAVLQLLQNQ